MTNRSVTPSTLLFQRDDDCCGVGGEKTPKISVWGKAAIKAV